ncbi:ATP-binding protein [Pleionea sp. CnH1-48]|uniref:ATP-binding protein n=1 Tax=Pleionea sp. CnH1-48 TaxID=2954494 RepID=UPI00209763BE|nr:ATP-binding protein [Pleionea sp. CnH1-48]MCO7224287.1 ATP-binding protein [Pleionea sp. CnH1-48]
MTVELHNTHVNMDGLLEVLGKNLYSSPAVAVRELVQNAHDACVRRQIEANYEGDIRISLSTDPGKNQLIIEDNGSGLTYDEVVQYLATVGSGYTRVLRNETQTSDMIGYFGLGFLSAYVVADKVDVWTTSYQTPEQSWHFSSSGGKRFALTEAKPREVGTRVCLQLSDNFTELSSARVLSSLVAKYCCLLPIPIYLKGDSEPLNNINVPWRLPEHTSLLQRKKINMEFAQVFEEVFEPICTIEIPANDLNAKGVMWIQDASGFSTSDYRNVSVFIRNMHITHEGRELLPLWAGFAGCVIETDKLTPTASREDLQKDQVYHQLQSLLSDALNAGLTRIANEEPETWRRVLSRHNQALLAAAVADDALFNVLKQDLKLPTSRGEMTIGQISKQCGQRIPVRMDDTNSYEDVLFRANHLPVVSGYLFAAASFCQKYSDYHGVKLVYLGSKEGNQQLFKEVQASPDVKQRLSDLFTEENEGLRMCEFEPDYIPLLVMEDKEARLKQKLEQDDADKRIGAAALSLAKLHTQKIDSRDLRLIIVNLNSPMIQSVLNSADNQLTQRVARMLRSYMLTMCANVSDDIDFSQELRQFISGLESFLEVN